MSIANQETPEVDENRWNAWLQQGKEAERRTTKRMKIVAGALLSLAAISTVLFTLTK